MNDFSRQRLAEIIKRFGKSICDNPKKFKGIVKDYFPGEKREVFILISSLRERVPADLLAPSSGVPKDLIFSRLERRLVQQCGMAEDAAKWVVGSWATALEVTLETVDSFQDRETPKPVSIQLPKGSHEDWEFPPQKTASPSKECVIVSQSGSADFHGITEAIKAVQPGTKILVRPGVYYESVSLDNVDVEIIGDGPVEKILIQSRGSSCLVMKTTHASVRGLSLHSLPENEKLKVFAVDVSLGTLILDNCDVTSDSSACISIHGVRANPIVKNCRIHHSKSGSGVWAYENARGTLENCDIFENKFAGVEIKDGASLNIRNCKIHNQGSANGVLIFNNSTGVIEECEIFKNKFAGIEITDGGNPSIKKCKIHNHDHSNGIAIFKKGQATVEDCEVFENNGAGIEAKESGSFTIRRCVIHHCKGAGIRGSSKGTIEGCKEFSNGNQANSEKTSGIPPHLQSREKKIEEKKAPPDAVTLRKDNPSSISRPDDTITTSSAVKIPKKMNPPKTVFVSLEGNAHFNSISQAIQEVESHTRIMVLAGVYKESITLDKEVEIIGSSPENVCVEAKGKPCLLMNAKKAEVRGISFHTFPSFFHDSCTIAISCGNLLLDKCVILSDSLACISIFGLETNPIVRNCLIRGSKKGAGVLFSQSSAGVIEDCEICENKFSGISVSKMAKPTILRCKIHHCKGYGISNFSKDTAIEKCSFLKNEPGDIYDAGFFGRLFFG
ncbi:right-handed parallel beta-helix repeat-containing protein [bacterium]|nr:right-handed parallel beta-helix repeat-containing protein [bacterium]